MSNQDILVSPIKMGDLTLPNRVLMAPLTRSRADDTKSIPGDLASLYYRQRASAGLIISEAAQISETGKGFIATPGIYSKEQISSWQKVVDDVHAAGGRIFCQLWHVGRISHTDLQPARCPPVAPSAIRAHAKAFTSAGFVDCSEPRALTMKEILGIIEEFGQAAAAAREAGFDGVELHSANGYLLDQFLRDSTNHREDIYGGSIENRIRLLREVILRVSHEIPTHRIGVRLTPLLQGNDIRDSDPEKLFSAVYKMLDKLDIGYVHVVEQFTTEPDRKEQKILLRLRKLFPGFYIVNGCYDGKRAREVLKNGYANAVSFGRAFIANPDLPYCLHLDAPLNDSDHTTYYGGGREGYTDYPFFDPALHNKNISSHL